MERITKVNSEYLDSFFGPNIDQIREYDDTRLKAEIDELLRIWTASGDWQEGDPTAEAIFDLARQLYPQD